MYGENKKAAINQLSKDKGYDLREAKAYGDHISDLPILESVGYPVAINPSSSLRKIAIEKGWEIHNWNL